MRLPKGGFLPLSPGFLPLPELLFLTPGGQARGQDPECVLPVLRLGAFALADGGEPGGQMYGADCGRRLLHVLPSGSAGAEGLDADLAHVQALVLDPWLDR